MLAKSQCVFKHETDINFSLNKGPLFCVPQDAHQLLKRFRVSRRIFKPRQEVKRLQEVMTMIQPPCDSGQIVQSCSDVMRTLLKNQASFVLSQLPPGCGLLDWDEGSTCCAGTAQARLPSD